MLFAGSSGAQSVSPEQPSRTNPGGQGPARGAVPSAFHASCPAGALRKKRRCNPGRQSLPKPCKSWQSSQPPLRLRAGEGASDGCAGPRPRRDPAIRPRASPEASWPWGPLGLISVGNIQFFFCLRWLLAKLQGESSRGAGIPSVQGTQAPFGSGVCWVGGLRLGIGCGAAAQRQEGFVHTVEFAQTPFGNAPGAGARAALGGPLRPAPNTPRSREDLAWCCRGLREPCWGLSEQLCLLGLLLEKALFGCAERRGSLGGGLSPLLLHAWSLAPWTTGLMPGDHPHRDQGLPLQQTRGGTEPSSACGSRARPGGQGELGKNERETPASASHFGSRCQKQRLGGGLTPSSAAGQRVPARMLLLPHCHAPEPVLCKTRLRPRAPYPRPRRLACCLPTQPCRQPGSPSPAGVKTVGQPGGP